MIELKARPVRRASARRCMTMSSSRRVLVRMVRCQLTEIVPLNELTAHGLGCGARAFLRGWYYSAERRGSGIQPGKLVRLVRLSNRSLVKARAQLYESCGFSITWISLSSSMCRWPYRIGLIRWWRFCGQLIQHFARFRPYTALQRRGTYQVNSFEWNSWYRIRGRTATIPYICRLCRLMPSRCAFWTS